MKIKDFMNECFGDCPGDWLSQKDKVDKLKAQLIKQNIRKTKNV